MYWLLGFIVIILLAFIIIKLTVDTNKNPDSNLGILDHPSVFEKQNIELVDKSLKENKDTETTNTDTKNWDS